MSVRQAYKYLLLLMLLFISEQKMAQRIEMQICLGSSCFSRGNKEVVNFIREYLRKNHLDDKVIFKGARCMGLCSNGPNLNINGVTIEGVNISRIEGILEKELSRLL
jgi:NADH:ubiquinone oxidoreductase subunit E